MEIFEVDRIGSRSFEPVRHSNEEGTFRMWPQRVSMERDQSTLTTSTCEFDEASSPAHANSISKSSWTIK